MWPMSGEAKGEGSNGVSGAVGNEAREMMTERGQDYSERVRAILLRQPLNPLVKLKFSVMPRMAS